MKELIEQLKQAEHRDLVIIGDVMLDEYVFGSVARISPEAPVPILREERKEWSLGGSANVALNCRHIGCNVHLIGTIGIGDQSSDRILNMLEHSGISTNSIVKSSTRRTTTKIRMMAQRFQLIRVDIEDTHPLDAVEEEALCARIRNHIRPKSMVIVSDYAKGVVTPKVMHVVLECAYEHGATVLVDPKGPDFEKYYGATYMKPNLKEFGELVHHFKLSRTVPLVENARALVKILGLNGLVITRGEEGITFVSASEEITVEVQHQEVFDLTGAGDTVVAFLAFAMLNNISMRSCLHIANKAAAVAISHVKTYAVGLDELNGHDDDLGSKYIQDWNVLERVVTALRNKGKRIVFTNGCYDLLHSGHIHLLKEAKKLGDTLVVAINTDASIEKLKGPGRPVKPLRERANVLAALGMVDLVTQFDEDTPLSIIQLLKPDVLVKGTGYKPDEIVGYQEVTQRGGEVVIVGWKNEHSTTTLVQRMQAQHHTENPTREELNNFGW